MKNIIKFLFHRAFLTGLSIVLQLIILLFIIWEFNEYYVVFATINRIISTLAVIYILNVDINPGYKLAWIIPILVFPIFGGLFYLFFGGKKLSKRVQRGMKYVDDSMKNYLREEKPQLEAHMEEDKNAVNQSLYIKDYAFSPVYANTYTEYFPTGESNYEKLLEELKKAEKFIFMEYFIIERGLMWNSILEILVEKVKSGVDVRLMYDDLGSLMKLPGDYDKTLISLGIKCVRFNPFKPVLSSRLNNRDHRKITVVDGKVGFTGGINLADEYINEVERFGHWKDTGIMLEGEGVWTFTVMFLSLWNYSLGTTEDYREFRHKWDCSERRDRKENGFIQAFTDNPLDNEMVGETIYFNMINKAKRYVYINTPYLILDTEMIMALTTAAKSGIDVRIVTPKIPDKKIIHNMTRSYYAQLIEKGVKIYEYSPGFMHAKSIVVDDEYALVGTINLDYRSLYLHYECGVWMYKSDTIYDIKKDFIETMAISEEISLEKAEDVPFLKRIGRSVLRVFAPLM